jgi:hypothetical protein
MEESIKYYEHCLKVTENLHGSKHHSCALVLSEIAGVYLNMDRKEQAVKCLLKA